LQAKKKSIELDDLAETFTNMCRTQLKLNPEKCVFGVHRGKVLGCLVSVKGIELNPDKIKAITHMKPPQSRKEIQKLIGRTAALNRFMSKLVEWSLTFFIVPRGSDNFEWGPEQQKTFDFSTLHTTVNGSLVQEKETRQNEKKTTQ
jgi:phage FluMu protein gp41